MKSNYYPGILVVLLALTFYACAQQKKAAANGKAYATISEASMQRTMPGRREGAIEIQYRFILTWRSDHKPETFFYKGPDAWMNCRLNRLSGEEGTKEYKAEAINPSDVREGDKIELLPMKGGKYPVPADIPPDVTNVILFKTNNSSWRYLEVNNITRKPDIVMP